MSAALLLMHVTMLGMHACNNRHAHMDRHQSSQAHARPCHTLVAEQPTCPAPCMCSWQTCQHIVHAAHAALISLHAQVLAIATVFQLLSSLSAVAVPKLAGQLVDVAIKADQSPDHRTQQKHELNRERLTSLASGLSVRTQGLKGVWPLCRDAVPDLDCPGSGRHCQRPARLVRLLICSAAGRAHTSSADSG